MFNKQIYWKMTSCLPGSEPDMLTTWVRSRSNVKLTLQFPRQHIPLTMVSPRLGSFYLQLTGEFSYVSIIRVFPQKGDFINASPPWALQTYSTLQDFATSLTWVVPGWQLWQRPLSGHLTHHRARPAENFGACIITYQEQGTSRAHLCNGLLIWNTILSKTH